MPWGSPGRPRPPGARARAWQAHLRYASVLVHTLSSRGRERRRRPSVRIRLSRDPFLAKFGL
jgi:hypothetical protein